MGDCTLGPHRGQSAACGRSAPRRPRARSPFGARGGWNRCTPRGRLSGARSCTPRRRAAPIRCLTGSLCCRRSDRAPWKVSLSDVPIAADQERGGCGGNRGACGSRAGARPAIWLALERRLAQYSAPPASGGDLLETHPEPTGMSAVLSGRGAAGTAVHRVGAQRRPAARMRAAMGTSQRPAVQKTRAFRGGSASAMYPSPLTTDAADVGIRRPGARGPQVDGYFRSQRFERSNVQTLSPRRSDVWTLRLCEP